ncbi:hypothetical protein HDU76_008735 [Blyttiomyces sp. JEL0837]|nr:hypothetical protein HDU76_008735 [Blyttiomyces sp. JEL0837]
MVVGQVPYFPYDQFRINGIAMRSSAMTLNAVNLFLWGQTFKNKRATVALMSLAFILLQQIGTIVQSIDTFNGYAGMPTYIKDKMVIWAVIPFRNVLNTCVLAFMWLESATVLINYLFWAQAAGRGDFQGRVTAAQMYNYMNYVEAGTSFLLSGYFLWIYYMPRLKVLRGTKLFAKFFSSGSNISVLTVAARHSLFLSFIYRIRNATELTTTQAKSFGNNSSSVGPGDSFFKNPINSGTNGNQGPPKGSYQQQSSNIASSMSTSVTTLNVNTQQQYAPGGPTASASFGSFAPIAKPGDGLISDRRTSNLPPGSYYPSSSYTSNFQTTDSMVPAEFDYSPMHQGVSAGGNSNANFGGYWPRNTNTGS